MIFIFHNINTKQYNTTLSAAYRFAKGNVKSLILDL